MTKYEVRTVEKALAYITDCTLGTVVDMAARKRRPKREFERQMRIAQTAIDWIVAMGVDASTTRVEDVLDAGNVRAWAERYMKP